MRIYHLEIQVGNFRRKKFYSGKIWPGRTRLQNGDAFKQLLKQEIFINNNNKNIKGHYGIELLKRDIYSEIKFIAIMYFENLNAIEEFAGVNCVTAIVPENARRLLLRHDDTSQHYEILKEREHWSIL